MDDSFIDIIFNKLEISNNIPEPVVNINDIMDILKSPISIDLNFYPFSSLSNHPYVSIMDIKRAIFILMFFVVTIPGALREKH